MPNDTSLRDELTAGFEGTGSDPSATDAAADATALNGSANAPAPEGSGELAPLEAPSHWQEADRTLFGKAPRDLQQNWLDRDKRYSQGFDKVSKEAAQLRRDREGFDEIFRDRDRELGLAGLTRQQFVSQLVQWNDFLSKDPAGAIRALTERLGVDLKTLTEAPATDPNISGLNKRMDAFEQRAQTQERERQQQAFRSHLSSVEAFASAKGQDGKLLHPYFDEVSGDVIANLQAMRSQGIKPDLDVAYTKALRMNDKVWEKVQAEQAAAKAKKEESDRKSRVDQARRAAAGTSGEGNGTTQPKSLREDLEAGFSAWSG